MMEWQPAPDALIEMMDEKYDGVLSDVRFVRLPFYEDGYLVEARIEDNLVHAVLGGKHLGATIVPLDGAVGQLGAANYVGGLVLTRENAGEYAKFFCGHLARSEYEAFTFVEDLNGKALDNGHKLRDMRVKVRHKDEEGAYWVGGYQSVEGLLFRVSILVLPDGLIQMRDDIKMGELVTVN